MLVGKFDNRRNYQELFVSGADKLKIEGEAG
jgi:hypothetical protein